VGIPRYKEGILSMHLTVPMLVQNM